MPGRILSSIIQPIHLDSLNIINGNIKYAERFAIGSKPAVITFNALQMSVKGISRISNRTGIEDTAFIHARCNFMQVCPINLFAEIPITSPEISFRYSGSAGGLNLSDLNIFLEIAEHKRIKTGFLRSGNIRRLHCCGTRAR